MIDYAIGMASASFNILSETLRRGMPVNKEILKGKWLHVRDDVPRWWRRMTDDDVDMIEGDGEKFLGKLHELYGYGPEQAERELNEFLCMPDHERRRSA